MKSKFGSGEKRQYQNLLNKDQQFKRTKKKDELKSEDTAEKDTAEKDKSNDVVKKLEETAE